MVPLRFRANGPALFSFFIMVLALAEAHECAHIFGARAVCGAWGTRNFSVWTTREGCAENHPLIVLAIFAGPLFTFAMIWLGTWIVIKPTRQSLRALGIALIFAPLPFARIVTAATGHGDEVSGFTMLLNDHRIGWAVGLASILLLSLYPVLKAYRSLAPPRRLLVFGGLLLLPMLAHGLTTHSMLNGLLVKGVLDESGMLGAPVLVNVWQVLVFAAAVVCGRQASRVFATD
jgi:hypothetical protein